MPSEPLWLPVSEIVSTNLEVVAATGEPFGLIKPNDLESACHRPFHLWSYDGEIDMVRLAVGLMIGLARNHPFLQGNKRTGFISAMMFLNMNGWDLSAGLDSPELGWAMVETMRETYSEEKLAFALRPYVKPGPTI